MEAFGVRLVFAPGLAAVAAAFVLGGVALGTVSGLTPGLHVNAMALLLAAAAPAVPGPPHLVAAAMLAAAVVHSFLDVVPALALGVPDAAMAVTALPGHRLVLGGRGREALRLSALGSGLAVAAAVPLALPVTAVMTRAYPVIRDHLAVVLGGVALFLVVTERSPRGRLGGIVSLAVSGALGFAVLDLDPSAPLPADGVLAPLFAGLFGAPVLVDALRGGGVPPQGDAEVAASRSSALAAAGGGTLAGAVVGYVPGVSSAIAAVAALLVVPADGDRAFVVATSGVNTANAVFALFALLSLGTPRTGVTVAMVDAGLPLAAPVLVASALLAAAVGFALVVLAGDRYLAAVGRVDNARLSVAVLCLLACIAYLFAGVVGVAVYAGSALLGLLPPRLGCRRVHLMGVLLVPLAL